HDLEEVRPGGTAAIVVRTVGKHLQGTFVDDEHGKLVCPRAHHKGRHVLRVEPFQAHVAEAAGGEVHLAEHASCEGNRHCVLGRYHRAPLVVFVAQDALTCDEVGIGAAPAGGLVGAV